MKKVTTVEEAASLVKDGMTIMVGGFMACGVPKITLDQIVENGVKDLTLIANDTSFPTGDKGKLVVNNCLKKLVASHIGTNPETGNKMNSGELEVELVPQGSLIERIRCAGFGLGGVLTPTGIGTVAEKGKEIIERNGKKYILEEPLSADVAIIYGTKVDKLGNVSFEGTTINFNKMMAMAAKTVIVEAEQLVEVGEIKPHEVVIPAILVDHIVMGDK